MKTAIRAGSISLPVNIRLLVVSGLTVVLTWVAFASHVALGDYPLTLADVMRVLLGDGTAIENKIVFEVRMSRAVVAVLTGMALGFAGALTQSVARNPLASPDVLGITQGAACAVVLTIAGTGVFLPDSVGRFLTGLGLPLVAILGAFIAASVIWWLAKPARGSTMSLVLIGVGAAIFLQSISTWAMAYTDTDRAASARLWITGSLNGRDWNQMWGPLLAVVGALLIAGWLSFQLSALSLGNATAHTLGHNVTRAQLVQLIVALILTAVAVSAAGPIGFVAFVTPQIARLAGGTPTPPPVLSALMGGLLVLTADLVARVALPWELPVGIITAFFGAPVLIALIISLNRKSSV